MVASFNKGDFEFAKTILSGKKTSQKKKRFYKKENTSQNLPTSLKNYKRTTIMFLAFRQSYFGISHSRSSIDFQN